MPLINLFTKRYLFRLAKLKAFADDKLNLAEKLKFNCSGRVENIVGRGENAGEMFSKGFFPRVVYSRDCVVKT